VSLDNGRHARDITFEDCGAGVANRCRASAVLEVGEGNGAGVEYILNRGMGGTTESRRASHTHGGLRLSRSNESQGKDTDCY
jgi:hypothetical protein